MGRLVAAVAVLAVVTASTGARAQEPDVQPAVPTLARLCAAVRAELASGGWYEPSSVRCAVTRRARGVGIEVAALTVTAERLSRDTEVRIAVRGTDGWRVIGTAGLVQFGHGWLGAIAVRGCRVVRRGEVEVEVRSWSAEADVAPRVPAWERHVTVCTEDGV